MANSNAPLMSQGARTPITSVGSGNANLQDTRNLYSSNGSGMNNAAIGALVGAMVADKTGTKGTGTTGGTAPKVGGGTVPNIATPAGNASNPGGLNTYGGSPTLPTGNIGSTVSISLPSGTTQPTIDAVYGKSNGQSNYVISGVNPSDGSIIATPNYNIGGGNLTGIGGVTPTATAPSDQTAGTYFQDSYGNIYDGSGNLYAVNNGGAYYVKTDPNADAWMNSDTGATVDSNTLFNYTGGGYDPSADTPVDTSTDYYNSDDYFSQPDASIADWYPDFKNGGMATPLMAKGGGVKGYAGGSLVDAAANSIGNASDPTANSNNTGILQGIQDLLSGTNVKGALLGTLISQLMSGSSNNNTYKGVDMSQVGNIQPVTTNFGMGPTNYFTSSDYMEPMDSSLMNSTQSNQLNADLGATGFSPHISPLGQKPVGKANGGRIPTHYTFGTQVNPEDFFADGGMPHNTNVPMTGGLSSNSNVPMLQGRNDYRNGAEVKGEGDGQSDDIPAMLADGEYVIDADVVAALGNGSNKAGADVLDKFRQNIRTHKRSNSIGKIPPKAKSPLAYLKGAK
jgi:hypothetical protein